ncbi:MAG: V4R domain-containing protein [Nitrososphaerota archaeon]|nr:V4R domain-containing protein [Nitrososphaerota archaeon]
MSKNKIVPRLDFKPLDLSRMIMDPDFNTYFISVTLVNKSGALASFLDLLKNHNLNIIGIMGEAVTRKDEIEVSIFLETPVKMDRIKLEIIIKKETSRMKVVKDIKIFDHFLEGFDADVRHFPLTIGKMRVAIFPLTVLEGFIKTLRRAFDKPISQTILWHQGKEIGKTILESYERDFGLKGVRALEFLRVRALLFGWTYVEIYKFEELNKTAIIRLFDNWECELFKENDEPQNHFMRGILTGFFNGLFGVEVDTIETKCIAKGDPFCEFTVKEKKSAEKT